MFLPQLVSQDQVAGADVPYRDPIRCRPTPTITPHLAQGDVDVVVGNWLKPPEDLHLGKLFADEVVCLVSKDHPAARRGWTREKLAGGRAHRAHARRTPAPAA